MASSPYTQGGDMSAIRRKRSPNVERIAKKNPAVEAAKVREAQEQLREIRKGGRRHEPLPLGSPYGARVRKNSRGFGTTYG
jgi:hypothetical protein